jgi:hypothetical protein
MKNNHKVGCDFFPPVSVERLGGPRCNCEEIREFPSGATKSPEGDKLDYEGFLSPIVLKRYAQYMHKHRVQSDGKLRPSNNWQKGIPRDVYMKSMWRHFMDVWMNHHGAILPIPDRTEALCALLFNVMGYLHEELKQVDYDSDRVEPSFEAIMDFIWGENRVHK